MTERRSQTPDGHVSINRTLGQVGIDKPTFIRWVQSRIDFPFVIERGRFVTLETAHRINVLVEELRAEGVLRPRRKNSRSEVILQN